MADTRPAPGFVRAAAAVMAALLAATTAAAAPSLFWLQTDGQDSRLGTATNPVIEVSAGRPATLYLWMQKDAVTHGFDGIALDVRALSSDGGQVTVTLEFDAPPGRWSGASSGEARSDSGGQGVRGANAVDLTNTDTLPAGAVRLAVLTVSPVHAGTVWLFLCVGEREIIDGGQPRDVWFGFATASTSPETLAVNGGQPEACSGVPEATIYVDGQGSAYVADFDGDLDVDQQDFGYLQRCLNGPVIPQTDPDCADAELTGDVYVDEGDFAVFQQCFSGPTVTPPANCLK